MSKLAIGRITKSYGLKGYCKVLSYSGESDHFLGLNEIFLFMEDSYIEYRVESVRIHARQVLLQLNGIDTPERAKSLAGSEIWVERKYAAKLEEGQYYESDLCRCHVYQKGKRIGAVRSILSSGALNFLEVSSGPGRMLMIPFSDPFVGDIDTKGGTIQLKEDYEID